VPNQVLLDEHYLEGKLILAVKSLNKNINAIGQDLRTRSQKPGLFVNIYPQNQLFFVETRFLCVSPIGLEISVVNLLFSMGF
jgi:hypothetical protein